MRIRNLLNPDPGWKNSDPGETFRIRNTADMLHSCAQPTDTRFFMSIPVEITKIDTSWVYLAYQDGGSETLSCRWIPPFTVMRIRIRLFTLTRIRTWLLEQSNANIWRLSTDSPQLNFESPSLKWAFKALDSSWILTSLRIRIQLSNIMRTRLTLLKIMWIRICNPLHNHS